MAHLVRQKEAAPPPPVIPERLAKLMKKSGFVVPQASQSFGYCWDASLSSGYTVFINPELPFPS